MNLVLSRRTTALSHVAHCTLIRNINLLAVIETIFRREHTCQTPIYTYYQSMITIMVAVLLIHVFGRKSKSHPGVRCDVSHLRVCTHKQMWGTDDR